MIAKLNKIHKKVFDTFVYQTDKTVHGRIEYWSIPEHVTKRGILKGDCEEFALACRYLCRQEGIVSQLAICEDECGEMHCVLHVNGLILDNRQPQVRTVDELTKIGYNWIAISGNEPGEQWHAVLPVK